MLWETGGISASRGWKYCSSQKRTVLREGQFQNFSMSTLFPTFTVPPSVFGSGVTCPCHDWPFDCSHVEDTCRDFSQPWSCGHHCICRVFPDGQLEGWRAGWCSRPSWCLQSPGVDWGGGHTRESWPKADDFSPIKLALCFSALRNLTAKTALMKSCQRGYCLNSVCSLGLKSWL